MSAIEPMPFPHAVLTEDEEIWFTFSGEVPRAGEEIRFLHAKEVSGGLGQFRVKHVFWFVAEREQSYARVVVEVPNAQDP